jgi:hypothetical protein
MRLHDDPRDSGMIQIINGLVYGSFLYLLSVGLVLIFGLRRVTNFAHGGLFMLGAYIAFAVSAYLGFWAGLVVSVIGLAALGVLLDRFVFRPLAGENRSCPARRSAAVRDRGHRSHDLGQRLPDRVAAATVRRRADVWRDIRSTSYS